MQLCICVCVAIKNRTQNILTNAAYALQHSCTELVVLVHIRMSRSLRSSIDCTTLGCRKFICTVSFCWVTPTHTRIHLHIHIYYTHILYILTWVAFECAPRSLALITSTCASYMYTRMCVCMYVVAFSINSLK